MTWKPTREAEDIRNFPPRTYGKTDEQVMSLLIEASAAETADICERLDRIIELQETGLCDK